MHFDRNRLPDAPIFWRRRGDQSFQPLTDQAYRGLRAEFEAAERADLLDR